jgi:hypothetical protein
VLFDRHVSIISCYIDTPFFNPAGRKVPATGKTDIGLFDCCEVDEEFSVPKLDLLSLQGDHTLEKHHPVSGKTDSHHIKPFRAGEKVSQLETEIDPVIVVGGFHAVSLDQERRADITEKEVSRKGDQADPDQISRGQGRKKELTDLLAHNPIIKPNPPIS